MKKADLQKMLDQGIIEPCQSSWASPVILVTKTDGSTLFCMDYWKINKVTCKDTNPLQWIDNTLDALRGGPQYFIFIFGVLASKDGLERHQQDHVHYMPSVISLYGDALWVVKCTDNFQAAHGAGALLAQLEIYLIYLDGIMVYDGNFSVA